MFERDSKLYQEQLQHLEQLMLVIVLPSRYISRKIVNYQFENKNLCAFGNMANLCFLLNDDKAAHFFFHHGEGDMNNLREAHTKIHHKANIILFHLAREIVRQKFKYNVTFVKRQDLVEIAKENMTEVLYVMLQPANAIVTHVICIQKNRIIDRMFKNQLKCSVECLCWICSDSDFTFHGYIL